MKRTLDVKRKTRAKNVEKKCVGRKFIDVLGFWTLRGEGKEPQVSNLFVNKKETPQIECEYTHTRFYKKDKAEK